MKHTISVLVENHFGVLARVSGLFSARGFNIDSLCVGETEDPSVSRMTVVVEGDERVLEQIVKQLEKLVEVIEITDLTKESFVERELVMVKVPVNGDGRTPIIEIANIFRAKVVDISPESMIIEATGSEGKVKAFIDMMRPFGIKELVRTGRIAVARSLKNNE
ncbi:MAG TPA: acetolactate synthase small subunit [Candidatus Hydrogenedentes bacterium]|nr:acetolactate synthase small subunit [Candidatus Hydrogenedentota bacterium]